MSDDAYIGEIMVFAGNFAPRGWAKCEGQLMPIAQYTAVFSLLGTTYGGDGRTTFGLPDLNGRAAMHAGRGPGLSGRNAGQRSGVDQVALAEANMPGHTHTANVKAGPPGANNPSGASLAQGEGRGAAIYGSGSSVAMESLSAATGGTQPHTNIQPSLGMTVCICLQGIYPSRS